MKKKQQHENDAVITRGKKKVHLRFNEMPEAKLVKLHDALESVFSRDMLARRVTMFKNLLKFIVKYNKLIVKLYGKDYTADVVSQLTDMVDVYSRMAMLVQYEEEEDK